MSVCLDAFAFLAWLQDEPGADQVEGFMERGVNEEAFVCYLSTINLGEIFYRLYRLRGADEAETFWDDVRRQSLPITLLEPTRARIREAARLKGRYPIAYADAFAAQAAREKNVPLVTDDPELRVLESEGLISILWLPTS